MSKFFQKFKKSSIFFTLGVVGVATVASAAIVSVSSENHASVQNTPGSAYDLDKLDGAQLGEFLVNPSSLSVSVQKQLIYDRMANLRQLGTPLGNDEGD
jgi:hypothetical protein